MRELNYFELEYLNKNHIEILGIDTAKNKEKFLTEYTCSWIATKSCEHKYGWYGRVHSFWSRILELQGIRIYCCSDCGEILQNNDLKRWLDSRKEKI